jgi:hypothetical protein
VRMTQRVHRPYVIAAAVLTAICNSCRSPAVMVPGSGASDDAHLVGVYALRELTYYRVANHDPSCAPPPSREDSARSQSATTLSASVPSPGHNLQQLFPPPYLRFHGICPDSVPASVIPLHPVAAPLLVRLHRDSDRAYGGFRVVANRPAAPTWCHAPKKSTRRRRVMCPPTSRFLAAPSLSTKREYLGQVPYSPKHE